MFPSCSLVLCFTVIGESVTDQIPSNAFYLFDCYIQLDYSSQNYSMSLYNASPELAHITAHFHHVIGAISAILSAIAFYFLLFKTPKDHTPYTRHLIHVQVKHIRIYYNISLTVQIWVACGDLILSLLLVPVPLFPVFGMLGFGIFEEMGVNLHYLVVSWLCVRWIFLFEFFSSSRFFCTFKWRNERRLSCCGHTATILPRSSCASTFDMKQWSPPLEYKQKC